MNRKSRQIAFGVIIFLIVAGTCSYLDTIEHTERSWTNEYRVDIEASPEQNYSLIVPIPIYRNERGSVEDPAMFLDDLRVVHGHASFSIMNSSRGAGLQINGTGRVSLAANEKQKVTDDLDCEFELPDSMSLFELNESFTDGDVSFYIHSDTNNSSIAIEIRFLRVTTEEWISALGRVKHHDDSGFGYIIIGEIDGQGWNSLPGHDQSYG